MMSRFKSLQLFCLIFCFTLLSACASKTTIAPEPLDNNPVETPTVNGQKPQASAAALPMVADPMAGDLPLDLIKAYDQLKSMLAAKNKQQAIDYLQQLQARFPQQSGPSYRLARIYQEEGQFDAALSAIENCLSINPKNYYAQNLKGVILREQGQFIAAKETYIKALEIYPRHAQSHMNLAILADIYLYDLPLALQHYQYYLDLTKEEDGKINGWLIDLKRRLPDAE